ncbi:MAG TPA: AAA family ATPase, partial [Thermotogota bacterium]|nr:AAA family ATPase [Thermotogota bacterium]
MKKLPVGLQDFCKLRTYGYLYVDKTRFLYEMAKETTPIFLSRPRRFGKSLTVSTMKYLFQGEKSLFQDTWIYDRWDWNTRYPVVHISMTEVDSSSPDRLEESLFNLLMECFASFDLVLDVRLVKDAFRRL